MLRTGSGGGGVEAAPASPGGGFARTVSSTELGGAEHVADARRAAGRQKHDRHATSRRGAFPEASRAFVAKLAICALACLAALAALVLVGTKARGADSETRRLIVFDAGSSSTRVHVFELDVARRGGARARLPAVRAHFEAPRRASPGLADLELESDANATEPVSVTTPPLDDDDDARMEAYFEPLLRFAESVVPASARAETSLLLMATAGARALPPARAERALARCRSVLRRSAFLVTNASVRLITGEDEGLYAWIAANYAAGTLYAPPEDTVGVVELGGASAQVTFRPEKKPPLAYRAELVTADRKWAVYTHSALGLGLDAARGAYERRFLNRRNAASRAATPSGNAGSGADAAGAAGAAIDALSDPCALAGSGSFSGSPLRETSRGDFAACRAACAELMGVRRDAEDVADDARCLPEREPGEETHATTSTTTSDGRCGFGGSFLPDLRGSFLLTENFAHAVRFLRDAGFLNDADGADAEGDPARARARGTNESSGFSFGTAAAPVSTLSVARVADAGRRLCSTTREELAERLAERLAASSRASAVGDAPAERKTEAETAEEARALRIRNACFATSYVVAALADVLRVDETKNALRFGDEVRGVKVDWAVGAAIANEARNGFGRRSSKATRVSRRREDRSSSWTDLRAGVASVASATTRSLPNARDVGADDHLGGVELLVGLLLALALGAFAFVGPFPRASPSDAPRATRARLRLGELKVRRTLGMPSKGGVTSPTKTAAGEDPRKGI